MDSDCTSHITHDQELFKEFNKSNISKVNIGIGEQIALEVIRTTVIKIHLRIKLILIYYVLLTC